MQNKKRLLYFSFRHYVIMLAIISTVASNGTAFAQALMGGGGGSGTPYSCDLLATTVTDYPSGPTGEGGGSPSNPNGPYIYDDGPSNFIGLLAGDLANGGWNCGRQYLFTEYVDSAITFDFEYGIVASHSYTPY